MSAYSNVKNWLGIISRSTPDTITSLSKCVDYETVKLIAEILLNILKGVIPLSEKEIAYFRFYKRVIQKIISSKSSLKQKKEILMGQSKLLKNTGKIFVKYVE